MMSNPSNERDWDALEREGHERAELHAREIEHANAQWNAAARAWAAKNHRAWEQVKWTSESERLGELRQEKFDAAEAERLRTRPARWAQYLDAHPGASYAADGTPRYHSPDEPAPWFE